MAFREERPAPYVHQEYPRHVHKAGGLFLEVASDAARDAALEEGWFLTPVVEGEPVPADEPKKPGKKK